METWTFDDHDEFGEGPWADEPDKAVWVDPDTDLDCMIHRNRVGALCGYVGVGPDHILHGQSYGDWDEDSHLGRHLVDGLDVHGGVTYTAGCQDTICHVPLPGRTHDVWWIGFDCAHCGDHIPYRKKEHEVLAGLKFGFPGDTYKDFEYVKAECEKLARQLSEIDSLTSD